MNFLIMGLIHIYCGDGKGKTTAAIGLAIRTAGAGMKVNFVQLMKGGYTSEISILNEIKNITVSRCDKNYGFSFNMTQIQKNEITICHNKLISNAFNSKSDVIILDEFNPAYSCGLLDIELADNFILKKNPIPEIILTGRNPAPKFIEIADYISEINAVKHPFQKGITARKGIEF